MNLKKGALAFALIAVMATVVLAGCGGSATTVTKTVSGVTHAAVREPEPDFSGCPESKSGYRTGESIVAEGREGVEENTEVHIAEEDIRLGEKMERNAISGCRVERKLAQQEATLCANTPRELEEAFRLEETKASAEYIGIYEATCGKRVNLP